MMKIWMLPFLALFCKCAFSQSGNTANDFVPNYSSDFGYGVNLGAFQGWTDEDLANLAAGNPEKNVVGIKANTLRVWLPESFVEYWGYDIRKSTFDHYSKIGLTENVVFIGDPSPAHADSTFYTPGRFSHSFKNLYAPIWDDGADGTPINDTNYYARYVYGLVKTYGENIRIWEVTNEPDNDLGGNAAAEPGHPGNWWENNPPPGETKFGAPIFHYIRMLRITWEVVKSKYPESYVAIGGIGHPSFLDAVLRNSDNPQQGKTDSLFPFLGGAWFDCLSFHSYPHYDGSLRFWNNAIGGFSYRRHSDAALDGFLNRKRDMEKVLAKHGYDGHPYPKKMVICTETNLPYHSVEPKEYLGNPEAQRNFVIKSAISGQAEGIRQIHYFSLADHLPETEANSDFDFMGLYGNLSGKDYAAARVHDAGIAFKTMSSFLKDFFYDENLSKSLNLPANVRGAAFSNREGKMKFVLWAVTKNDLTEKTEASYRFSGGLSFSQLEKREWDFSKTGKVTCVEGKNINLTGTPIFLQPLVGDCPSGIGYKVKPNPASSQLNLEILSEIDAVFSAEVLDVKGSKMTELLSEHSLFAGENDFSFSIPDLASGLYFLKITRGDEVKVIKLVVSK